LSVLMGVACAQTPTETPEQPSNAPTLTYYLDRAREMSPAAAAAKSRSDAARATADGAGSLPDPSVTYGYYFEDVQTKVGPQVARFGVRQMIPLFGKRGLAKSAANHGADAADARTRAAILDVQVGVARAYAEYAYLGRAVAVTQERVHLFESLEEVVREAYAAGNAPYRDLMSAHISLAEMRDELASRLDKRAAVSSMLAAAVGLPDDPELPWPASVPDVSPVSEEDALARFRAGSPDLQQLDSNVAMARDKRSLAVRGYLPDLTLGVDYIVTDEAPAPVEGSGEDPIIGMATLSVPLWLGKHSADVRAANAALTASERERENTENRLTAALRSTLYDVGDARRRVALYRDTIIPDAKQSLAATDAAYRAGSADFDALIMAHQTVLAYQLALERARADVLIGSAELARRTGTDLGDALE
jgi:outer membrane protein, heavy metal efflux system